MISVFKGMLSKFDIDLFNAVLLLGPTILFLSFLVLGIRGKWTAWPLFRASLVVLAVSTVLSWISILVLRCHNYTPVRLPISMVTGTIKTVEFKTSYTNEHEIQLFVEDQPYDANLMCRLGGFNEIVRFNKGLKGEKGECAASSSAIDISWVLHRQGTLVAQGISKGGDWSFGGFSKFRRKELETTIGKFQAEKNAQYVLTLNNLRDGSILNQNHPRLEVNVSRNVSASYWFIGVLIDYAAILTAVVAVLMLLYQGGKFMFVHRGMMNESTYANGNLISIGLVLTIGLLIYAGRVFFDTSSHMTSWSDANPIGRIVFVCIFLCALLPVATAIGCAYSEYLPRYILVVISLISVVGTSQLLDRYGWMARLVMLSNREKKMVLEAYERSPDLTTEFDQKYPGARHDLYKLAGHYGDERDDERENMERIVKEFARSKQQVFKIFLVEDRPSSCVLINPRGLTEKNWSGPFDQWDLAQIRKYNLIQPYVNAFFLRLSRPATEP